MTMTMRLIPLALLFSCCAGPKPRPPADPQCKPVCERFRALGCPEGDPTPHGETCEAVCQRIQESMVITFDLTCYAGVDSCDAISKCHEK